MTAQDKLLQVLISPANLDINGLANSVLGSFAVIEKCKIKQPCVFLLSFDDHLLTLR
jgi:hypothetical protein